MTIRVINGAIVVNDGPIGSRIIRRSDGPVRLPKRLEDRFVRLGAAEYVTDEPIVEEKPDELVDEDVDDAGEPDGSDEPVDSDDTEESDGTDYAGMDVSELRAACDERGISYGKRANSAQLIRLLEADDEPPAIEAHGVDS